MTKSSNKCALSWAVAGGCRAIGRRSLADQIFGDPEMPAPSADWLFDSNELLHASALAAARSDAAWTRWRRRFAAAAEIALIPLKRADLEGNITARLERFAEPLKPGVGVRQKRVAPSLDDLEGEDCDAEWSLAIDEDHSCIRAKLVPLASEQRKLKAAFLACAMLGLTKELGRSLGPDDARLLFTPRSERLLVGMVHEPELRDVLTHGYALESLGGGDLRNQCDRLAHTLLELANGVMSQLPDEEAIWIPPTVRAFLPNKPR